MRTGFRVAVAAAALALHAQAYAAPTSFADAVMASTPIAYWRFGEASGTTALDAAIGHDGTYSASGITLGVGGLYGGDTGALFDGVNGRVTVPNDAELGPDFITMEALVRWDAANGFQQRILEKSFFAGGEQASYSLSVMPDGTVRVELRSGGSATAHNTIQALTAGHAAYVVGTYDGVTVSIYIDGVLAYTGLATPGALQDGVNPLGIGNQFERDRPFRGVIDELALYDHALTGAQVGQHFAALAIPEPEIVLLLGAGLGVIGFLARRRRHAPTALVRHAIV